MLTLFGSRGSGSAAIECALRHCGVPYTIVRASTWEADSAQAELAKANPLGQIPTLILEDGTVLTEIACQPNKTGTACSSKRLADFGTRCLLLHSVRPCSTFPH